jgi:hypothetical protein
MRHARLLLALALLAAVGAGAAALVAWSAPEEATGSSYAVLVAGPTGPLFDGAVHVGNATALSALRATGLDVRTREYPGMGTYVEAIAGQAAHGAQGWVYEVLRAGAWESGDRSAAYFPLHDGDALRWSWTSGG